MRAGTLVKDVSPVAPALITASGGTYPVTLGISVRSPPTSNALPIGVPRALTCVIISFYSYEFLEFNMQLNLPAKLAKETCDAVRNENVIITSSSQHQLDVDQKEEETYVSITACIAMCGTLTPSPRPSPVNTIYTAHFAVEVSVRIVVKRPEPIPHKTWASKMTGICTVYC